MHPAYDSDSAEPKFSSKSEWPTVSRQILDEFLSLDVTERTEILNLFGQRFPHEKALFDRRYLQEDSPTSEVTDEERGIPERRLRRMQFLALKKLKTILYERQRYHLRDQPEVLSQLAIEALGLSNYTTQTLRHVFNCRKIADLKKLSESNLG